MKTRNFDQNPAGSDEGNEWVTLHNPTNKSEDIGNWTFESTHGTTAIDRIPEGTTLYPSAYYTGTPFYRWLGNSEEAIILRNAKGEEVDRTPVENPNNVGISCGTPEHRKVAKIEKLLDPLCLKPLPERFAIIRTHPLVRNNIREESASSLP